MSDFNIQDQFIRVAKAKCRVGSVECDSSTPLGATTSALKNLRLNIPLWSNQTYGIV